MSYACYVRGQDLNDGLLHWRHLQDLYIFTFFAYLLGPYWEKRVKIAPSYVIRKYDRNRGKPVCSFIMSVVSIPRYAKSQKGPSYM